MGAPEGVKSVLRKWYAHFECWSAPPLAQRMSFQSCVSAVALKIMVASVSEGRPLTWQLLSSTKPVMPRCKVSELSTEW